MNKLIQLKDNLGNLLFPKIRKDIMTAYTSARPVLNEPTSYSDVIIPLDTSISVGSLLTFSNSNDRIIIGAGVKKIKISARCTIWTTPGVNQEMDFMVKKNGNTIALAFGNRVTGQNFNDYAISDANLNVTAGDYIQIAFNSGVIGNYTILSDGKATYLTVEVIE